MSADNCTVLHRLFNGWGVWSNQSMSQVAEGEWKPSCRPPDKFYYSRDRAEEYALDVNQREYHEYGVVKVGE